MSTLHLLVLMLLLHSVCTHASSSLQQLEVADGDRRALLAVKLELSDPMGWLSSWNSTSSDVCRWTGVTCSRRHPGKVASVDMSSRQLSGMISPAIGNLTFLRELSLESNMLAGHAPSAGYAACASFLCSTTLSMVRSLEKYATAPTSSTSTWGLTNWKVKFLLGLDCCLSFRSSSSTTTI